ncbi:MAG: hybrid sensor histidine kinase/response regulator [Gemmatimonadetes bacterium]|nr:MAG: hybrid sensor histidine kinase/response regulator [Gemmatimonadota bacterium]
MDAPAAKPRVLCVDDEPEVLRGLRTVLRRRFDVHTAESGREGLALLSEQGPFAVVVSDMKMPEMDGAAFLAAVKDRAPDTTRVLLTGEASLSAAVAAVNSGQIFRFLLKPCPADTLVQALEDAVAQHRMVTRDRELLRHEVDRLTEQLQHADRLASLGTMAGAVGHELANVATVLQAAVVMVGDAAREGRPAVPEDVADLEWVLEHLQTHATNLLRLARPGEDACTQVDLGQLARRTLDLLRSTKVAMNVDLEVDAPATPVRVHANRTRLEQVLLNLVKNAVDAVQERSDVEHPRVRLSVREDRVNRRVVCTVEDNGCGIPEAHLRQLFEPYFTTKPPDRGTGLGLPIVRQIVESYGGDLSVSTEVGRGSAFTVSLPSGAAAVGAARVNGSLRETAGVTPGAGGGEP